LLKVLPGFLAGCFFMAGCQSGDPPPSGPGHAPEAARLIKEGDNKQDLHYFDDALIAYAKATQFTPDDPRIYWRIACAAERAGRPEIGIQALRTLVLLDPALDHNPDVQDLARSLVAMQRSARP